MGDFLSEAFEAGDGAGLAEFGEMLRGPIHHEQVERGLDLVDVFEVGGKFKGDLGLDSEVCGLIIGNNLIADRFEDRTEILDVIRLRVAREDILNDAGESQLISALILGD